LTQPAPPNSPLTLLLHDGELADVGRLLASLGRSFVERRGDLRAGDGERPWELVIGTPRRLLDRDWLELNPDAGQIAVCDRDSRTLQASLRRAGVALLVRRPVHPAALRALLLHALYRGPEKRRSPRVSIGAPISLRLGLRRQPAFLADLSLGGCRVLTARGPAPSKSLKLLVPAEVSGGKAFALRGTVLQCIEQPSGDPAYTVKFGGMRAGTAELLRRTIEAHAGGPAKLTEPAPEAPETPEAPEGEVARELSAETESARTGLAEEAERVVMGREISLSGMRVERSPLLGLGSDVRLAIHAGSGDQPLLVTAKVHRDDGDRGMVLRFHGLDPQAARQLSAVLDELPLVAPNDGDAGSGMIVSEILAGTA
jgi:hypothetical protein